MKRVRLTVLLAVLAAPALTQAQAPPTQVLPPRASVEVFTPTVGSPLMEEPLPSGEAGARPGQYWVDAEAILFWMRGQSLPPLVTSSPAGTPRAQAGVLGPNFTRVLFGDSSSNTGGRAGGRFETGAWFDDNRTLGVVADFLFLEDKAVTFAASSDGSTVLARPFFNTLTGQQASILIAAPGISSGSITARSATSGLIGGGLGVRENLNLGTGSFFRLDAVGGFRAFHFSDSLDVSSTVTNINPNNANFIPVGTQIAVVDRFTSHNSFYGFDVGLLGEFQSGPLSLQIVGKVAAGLNQEFVDIFGTTTIQVPGTPVVHGNGGLLALSSNIGHSGHQEATVIPEGNLRLAYQATESMRVTFGYTLIVWEDVVRASEQVDRAVNPTLLPGAGPVTGPKNPMFERFQNVLWIQGVSLGLEFAF